MSPGSSRFYLGMGISQLGNSALNLPRGVSTKVMDMGDGHFQLEVNEVSGYMFSPKMGSDLAPHSVGGIQCSLNM